MSPQPTAVPTSMAERQVERAKRLEAERFELAKHIDANRKLLRLMADSDELTDAQQDWLDDFYPLKERGEKRSKADIEATRRVKEEARKAA
jgi:hypothetical protein